MKFPKLLLRFTFFSTCITSARCGSFFSPEPEYFSSVKYQTKEKSKQFSSCVKNIRVDTTDHKLRVKFDIKCPKDFPFPIIDSTKDTLTSTEFKFEFFSNGKPITLDRAIVFPSNDGSRSGYYWRGIEIDSTLAFKNDTASLRKIYSVQAVIPFYAFQNLKAGKQNIEVKISQSKFCADLEQSVKHWNEALQDSCYYTLKNYSEKSLISGALSFSINVPPIYKTIIYGEGLQLQNDSSWSPSGMDNTIWNFSFPDIYYTIYSPKEMYYVSTPFERTTTSYDGKDTFNLYHYHPNDSIGISVYDHDWLSRDDWMGDWEGSLDKIREDYSRELSFDHIQWFCVHAKTIGIINK